MCQIKTFLQNFKQMKIINIFIFIILPLFTFSQENWETIGLGLNGSAGIRDLYTDSTNDRLIMVGDFSSIDTFHNNDIAVYDGNNWDCFSTGLNYGGQIFSIIEYLDTLYIGGSFWNVWNGDTIQNIAKWNGNTWVGLGFNTESIYVRNMRIINNELFIMGGFTEFNGIETNGIVKYNGSEWSNLYNLPNISENAGDPNLINDVSYYKGEYYVGGNFNNPDLTIKDIIKYNGTEWVDVGGSIKGGMSTVNRMVVYNNELIVSGAFFKRDGNVGNFTQKWNGTEWSEFINLAGQNNNYDAYATVDEMKIYNNKLYMSGIFRYANDMPCTGILVYDGNQVCSYASSMYGTVGAFGFYHDTLYIAGMDSIDHIDVNRIAKWIGGNNMDSCSVLQSVPQINDKINNLVIYPNPTNGEFNIKLNSEISLETEITIFSINGSKIFEKQFYQTSDIKINNLHLKKGVYFVKIKTDEFVQTKKLIIN